MSITSNFPGGGSNYTLLGSTEVEVSTSSATATQIGALQLSSENFTSDCIIYVKVRDKAGPRGGYFVGSDTYFFNYRAANASTSTLDVRMNITHRKAGGTGGAFTSYAIGSYTGYGVYPYSLDSSGNLLIYRRYNSTYSLTVNGTYVIEVYKLDYAPNQGNPFDYEAIT